MTLDYMFELFIDFNDCEYKKENKKLVTMYNTSRIEHFLVDQKPYQQMSDHFGLSVEIKYNNIVNKGEDDKQNAENNEINDNLS